MEAPDFLSLLIEDGFSSTKDNKSDPHLPKVPAPGAFIILQQINILAVAGGAAIKGQILLRQMAKEAGIFLINICPA